MRATVAVVVIYVLATSSLIARTQFTAQYDSTPDHIRQWYKMQRAPSGVPCCDVADGYSVEFDIRDGAYWVKIEGKWVTVPPEAVIVDSKNPTGGAVVWYVRTGGDPTAPDPTKDYFIRCFVPGALF